LHTFLIGPEYMVVEDRK